jgi:hypothetical protein
LAEGTYHITATARDATGNTGPASIEVMVTIDTTAPEAPSLAFHNGTLSGTAEPGSTMFLRRDNAPLATVTVGSSGVWSTTVTLPNGTYRLTAVAIDAAGNVKPASSELIVTVDSTAPNAPTMAFSNGSLSGSATPGSTVRVFSSQTLLTEILVGTTGTWSYTPTLATGNYHFTATVTDVAQNTRPVSSEVLIDRMPPAAPSIDLDEQTLSGTAESFSTVQVFRNGILDATLFAGSNGAWSYPLTFTEDGVYHFTAKAIDGAGNISVASSVIEITVDVTLPESTVTSPGFVPEQTFSTAAWDGLIQGTASDSGSGVQRVEVSIFQAGTSLYWNGSAFVSGEEVWLPASGTDSWSFNFPVDGFTEDDQYWVLSRATDEVGLVQGVPGFTFFNIDVV